MRPATADDVRLVYDLAMDPVVRKNSFSSAEITYSEHTQWYSKRMHDANFLLLLAFHRNMFAGQVRFDIDHTNSTIGISITDSYRSRGLGKVLLKLGVTELTKSHPEIRTINAFIRPENIPSIRLFEKFNFQFVENTSQKKQPAKKYILTLPRL